MRELVYSRMLATYDEEKRQEKQTVSEYLRYQNDLKIYELVIDTTTAPAHLTSHMILAELFKLADTTIRKFDETFASTRDDVKYLFAMIAFWLNLKYDRSEMDGVKNENYKRAFLVCFMKLALIDKLKIERPSGCCADIKDKSNDTILLKKFDRQVEFVEKYLNRNIKSSFSKSLEKLESDLICSPTSHQDNYDYLKDVKIKLNSFCPSFNYYESLLKCKKVNSKLDKFNLKLVHFLNEFQSIYMSFNYVCDIYENNANDLNDELKTMTLEKNNSQNSTSSVFRPLKLDEFFNASFLHNFIEELESRVNPDLYIFDLFGMKSLFKQIYCELLEIFNKVFSNWTFFIFSFCILFF